MPIIKSDERDPVKFALGQEMRRMQKEEPEKLAEFLAGLSEKEAEEIMYDQEYWMREKQFIDLSDDVPITMLMSGRGFGKMLDDQTPILTHNKGWVNHGDLVVGDVLFDETGAHTKVTGVYPQGTLEGVEFTFSDGSKIVSGENHLWNTWEHRDRKQYLRMGENKNAVSMPDDWPSWEHQPTGNSKTTPFGPKVRTTEEIVENFTHSSRKDRNHSIPVCGALEFTEKPIPVDPYIYGYWIGDGGAGRASFTVDGKDQASLIQEIERAGYTLGNNNCHKTLSLLEFLPKLRATGSFGTKIISEDYIYNSKEVRLAFLQGLMDSDGYIDPISNTVEFCSMEESHSEAVKFLACSFGYKAVLSEGDAIFNGRNYGTKYRVRWKASPEHNPFRLKRKAEAVKYSETQGFRNCHRMIKSFEYVPERPMTCITVDSKHSLYLAGKALIPTHNTYTVMATTKRAVEKHGVKDILVISPTARDFRANIWPTLESMYPKSHPNAPTWSPSKASILWPNGATAVCIPMEAGEGSPRGLNTELLVIEELGSFTNDILTQSLLTMRRAPAKCVIATTPFAMPAIIDLVNKSKTNPEYVKIINGSTYENVDNLAKSYHETVISRYEGTTLGRQELDGELILTNAHALWQQQTIDENTIEAHEVPNLVEICYGVDPAVLAKKSSSKGRKPDSTGLQLVGKDSNDVLYCLDGHGGSYSMEEWVKQVCDIFDRYNHMCRFTIAIEINIIGKEAVDMAFDRAGRPDVKRHIKTVFATNSKLQRASPYSLMAEQGKVKYVRNDNLKTLSLELTTFDGNGKSPNEFDAMMWACSQLLPVKKKFTTSYELLI